MEEGLGIFSFGLWSEDFMVLGLGRGFFRAFKGFLLVSGGDVGWGQHLRLTGGV